MDAMETLVRETLAEHAADAPSDERLLATVTDAPPRRPWLAGGLAAALVLGIAAGAVALRNTRYHAETAAPTVPAGYRSVSYHGISLNVPSRLRLNYQPCLPPRNEVDIFVGEVISCPPVEHPESPGTVVELVPYRFRRDYRSVPTTSQQVSGDDVRRGFGSAQWRTGKRPTGVIFAPSAGVVVAVTAPTRTAIDAILDSVRLTPVDALGCPSREPKEPESERAGLHPLSAIVCVYSLLGPGTTDSLAASGVLSERDAVATAAAVRSWITATGPVRRSAQQYRITFTYADGSTQTVAVPSSAITAQTHARLVPP
jgi:hypothetical protein